MFAARRNLVSAFALGICVCLGLYAAGWLHGRYLGGSIPWIERWINGEQTNSLAGGDPQAEESHEHDHEHEHTDEADVQSHVLELSEVARKNLGLTAEFLKPIELQTYQRSISVPAIIVDQPGRTRIPVSASMTGIVTHVHAVAGEAIQAGDLILEMRLTHEDLVTAQKEFLQGLGQRDIERKEIARIEGLIESGALPNKTLLDRQYSLDKVESLLRSEREALRLHGLSEMQISSIETDRRLLTEIKIFAPQPDDHSHEEIELSARTDLPMENEQGAFRLTGSQSLSSGKQDVDAVGPLDSESMPYLVVQDLHVQKGDVADAGDLLCVLADYSKLLIEGQAFETEAQLILDAKLSGWRVSAVLGLGDQSTKIVDLELAWIKNEIDPVSRTLNFYAILPNTLLQEDRNSTGQRHITWKFRIGQRMQLQIPVEQWVDQIVVPIDAVVSEGIERYVFQQNGDSFQRVAIHEKYRDQTHVVIENDGAIYPGDVIVGRGAHQIFLALKNKSGSAIDPHAGHNH